MSYAKVQNGTLESYPYTVRDLKRDNPSMSFPDKISDERLATDYGMFTVVVDISPSINVGQVVEQSTTPVLENGEWRLGWTIREMTPTEREQWRLNTDISRRNFCLELYNLGILSKDDVIVAAKGDWPASFNSFLTGKTEAEVVEAQVEWASARRIRRSHNMIDDLAVIAELSPEQVDVIFGWGK